MPEGPEKLEAPVRRRRDAAAVHAALRGDAGAFDELVERYFGMVFVLAVHSLRDRAAAEDAAQEVFLRAYLNLRTLKDPAFFAPWITQMTRNLVIDWVRAGQTASRLTPLVDLAEAEEFADAQAVNPREAAAEQERSDRLHRALRLLPEPQRKLIMAHFMDDMTKAEIAGELGVHPATVGRQLSSALSELKDTIETMDAQEVRACRG